MNEYKLLKTSKNDRVAKLLLANKPLNILNGDLISELTRAVDYYSTDPDISVILIKGEGKCFSAGADIKEHFPGQVRGMLEKFKELMIQIISSPKITVSSVHGFCMGGGFELALAADFCIASDDARFSVPEIKLGVFPPVATAWLPYMIGYRSSNKVCFSGCEFDAGTMKDMGLVNNTIKQGELDFLEIEFCKKFTELSSFSLMCAKRSLARYRNQLVSALTESVDEYLNNLMKSSDPIEGLNSFVEKRRPIWRHR